MSGNLSDVAKVAFLKWGFSDSAVTRPTQWFAALYTSAPTDAGGGTEINTSGTGYARQEITFNSTGTANTNDLVFGPALTNWGTVTHVAIHTGAGVFWSWTPLSASVDVTVSKQVTFTAGTLSTVAD